MKYLNLFTLLSLVVISGCQKWKRSGWITANVTLLDYYTHEPIDATVTYTYKRSYYGGTLEENTDNVGGTNSDGVFSFEQKIVKKNKTGSHQLNFYAPVYSEPYTSLTSSTIPLSPGSKNEKTIYLKGYYRFNLHVVNTNCTGPADSVFVNFGGTYTFVQTGCIDQLFQAGTNLFISTRKPDPVFRIISKKNGVIDTTYQYPHLDLFDLTTVEIAF